MCGSDCKQLSHGIDIYGMVSDLLCFLDLSYINLGSEVASGWESTFCSATMRMESFAVVCLSFRFVRLPVPATVDLTRLLTGAATTALVFFFYYFFLWRLP